MSIYPTVSRQNRQPRADFLDLASGLPYCLQERAFPVIPTSKQPAVKGWQRLPSTPDGRLLRLTGYLLDFPDSGLGLTLGHTVADAEGIDRLAVVDIDRPERLTEYQADVLEAWPWAVVTRKGWHCYMAPPPGRRWMDTRKGLPWGDFLANRAFSMGPGNEHPKGGLYQPMLGFGVGNVPMASADLLEALLSAPRTPERASGPPPTHHESRIASRAAVALETTGPGYRNPGLFNAVRLWAYRQPRGNDKAAWVGRVEAQAVALAERFPDRTNFPDAEAAKVGRQVAAWTFNNLTEYQRSPKEKGITYGKRNTQGLGIVSIKDFQDKQGYRAVLSAESRRLKNSARDAEIIRRVGAGDSYRSVGADVGLAASTVMRAVKRYRSGAGIGATASEVERALCR